MKIINAEQENLHVLYSLTIEHEGEEYLWEMVVEDDGSDETFYHHTKDGEYRIISIPEWLEDEDFMDLWESA
jgi:hypothetical protein